MARRRPKHAARRRRTPATLVATAAVLVLLVGVVAAIATGDGDGGSSRRQVSTRPSKRSTLKTGPGASISGQPLLSVTTGPTLSTPRTGPGPPANAQGPVQPNPCPYTGPPRTPPSVVDAPAAAGVPRWITVTRLFGNCGGVSAPFPTTDVATRIVYRSDAVHFMVFVVDLADPGGAGGYADVECQAPCAAQQPVTGAPAPHQLKVMATDGPWELLVQELR